MRGHTIMVQETEVERERETHTHTHTHTHVALRKSITQAQRSGFVEGDQPVKSCLIQHLFFFFSKIVSAVFKAESWLGALYCSNEPNNRSTL